MSDREDPRLAACDQHLPDLLRQAVPDDQARAAKITSVATADERYVCACGVPAHWFVRVYLPE